MAVPPPEDPRHRSPSPSVRRAVRLLQAAPSSRWPRPAPSPPPRPQTAARRHLRQSPPQRAADQIATAETSVLPYLLTPAAPGAARFATMARAGKRGHRWVRGAGSGAVVPGTAPAPYHVSRPHPPATTAAGLLPCTAAPAAVTLLRTRHSSSHFHTVRTPPA
ncbi:hypothetical protein [Streptomyces sp. NPDC003077]|uniref:hypothetical protein n=1 Tax=Streptomyces sp. NPDC003077 TaxID=3154443 RepID=UPI0033B8B9CA